MFTQKSLFVLIAIQFTSLAHTAKIQEPEVVASPTFTYFNLYRAPGGRQTTSNQLNLEDILAFRMHSSISDTMQPTPKATASRIDGNVLREYIIRGANRRKAYLERCNEIADYNNLLTYMRSSSTRPTMPGSEQAPDIKQTLGQVIAERDLARKQRETLATKLRETQDKCDAAQAAQATQSQIIHPKNNTDNLRFVITVATIFKLCAILVQAIDSPIGFDKA